MRHNDFEVTQHSGIDPQTESPKMVAQHSSAYAFVRPFTDGKDVLEIGHGDGYGSSFLAQKARHVTAVDLFTDNVIAASKKYPMRNLKFLQMNATELTFPENQFDVVCSFQVIEHIPQALLPEYVSQIRRVIKEDGVACLSTLNLKRNRKPGVKYDKSPHHDKEFTPEELKSFLSSFFKEVTLYGLYPQPKFLILERIKKWGLFNFLPASRNPVARSYERISVSDFRWLNRSNLDQCIDVMACCRK